MDFEYTEEQALFKKNLREAVEKEILPGYAERARSEGFPWQTIGKKLCEMGLTGFGVPEEYGGQGVDLDAMTAGLAVEEIGRIDNAWALYFMGLYNTALVMYHSDLEDSIKREWLPKLFKADAKSASLFTEPHGGTDLGDIRTTALLDGDHYVVNGTKSSVSYCDASCFYTMARMEPGTKGYKGCGLLLIPRDLPGVEISVYHDWGLQQVGRGDVFFKDVRVPAKYLMAAPGTGFQKVLHLFDNARPSLAVMAIATAERVIDETIKYCKERMSFGKPLAKYEAISFGLAEHYTHLQAAKLLAYKAFTMRDKGQWNAKESAMAKWFGCESAFDAIWFCTRAYGHLGYTTEYDVLQRLLDVMGWAWGDGGWEAQKIVIAREIGGREFLPYDRN